MIAKEKKIWCEQEDETLKRLFQEQGQQSWSVIAKRLASEFQFPRKSAKQCRERYENHICAEGVRVEWTLEQEQKLVQLHNQMGNKWSLISSQIPGKSDNCVKNHFYSKLRKILRKLNTVIHTHLRKQYRQINIGTLYKIVEATQQRFKEQPACGYSVSVACQEVQNRMLTVSMLKQQEFDSEERLKIYTDIIRDAVSVSKLYKRKSKKTRNSAIQAPNARKKKIRQAHIIVKNPSEQGYASDPSSVFQEEPKEIKPQVVIEAQQQNIKDILKDAGILKEQQSDIERSLMIRFSSRSSFKSYSENNNIQSDNQFCKYIFKQLMTAKMIKDLLVSVREVFFDTKVVYLIILLSFQNDREDLISTLTDVYILQVYIAYDANRVIIKFGMDIDIKQNQIQQLLKLQELFHNQYLTQELLNETISLYVRFVENIHHNQHPLRLYFMQKIRFVLSRPEVIKILEKQTLNQNRSVRQTVRGMIGVNEQDEIQIKKLAEEAKAEVRQNHLINLKTRNNADDELKQKERNMKIQMQMKIMEEVENNMNKFRKDLSQGKQKQQEKEKQINKIVNQQDINLNQRLANRKKRLRKKSVNLADKQVDTPPPIPIEELKLVHLIVTQTYQRFTRLTQNKMTKLENNLKENKGRVKIKMAETAYEEEQFGESPKPKQQTNLSNPKIAKQEHPQKAGISIKTNQHKQGRVTIRNTKIQQIEEQQF